jgi:hypothetical protein
MTYGEVSSQLRETMIWLLERRRIQQRIGGAGMSQKPVLNTEEDRRRLGEEIQRYRTAVLTYCLVTVRSAVPGKHPNTNERFRDPVAMLRHQLERAHATSPRDAALSDLLAGEPEFELIRKWQDLARLAVSGEREVTVGIRWSAMKPEQTRVVLKDTADLIRGLVVLDARYDNVPGWRHLKENGRLGRAAEEVSVHAAEEELDASVDSNGWHAPPGLIEGPPLPGIAGAVQAQHNVAIHLGRLPSAGHLRHVLVGQTELSRQAAIVAEAAGSPLTGTFNDRFATYRELVQASRTVGGELGVGRDAALESANAARRVRSTRAGGEHVGEALDRLAHLSGRVDGRIAAAVEHGFQEKLYFVAVTLPRLDTRPRDGVIRAAQKWIPVDSHHQTELLGLTRQRLKPVPIAPAPIRDATANRVAFERALSVSPGHIRPVYSSDRGLHP